MFKEPNLVNGCFFRMFLFFVFCCLLQVVVFECYLIWLVSYLGSLFNLRLSSIVGVFLVGDIVFSSAFRFYFTVFPGSPLPWLS